MEQVPLFLELQPMARDIPTFELCKPAAVLSISVIRVTRHGHSHREVGEVNTTGY